MNYYNVKDLREKLSEHVQSLGIDPKFLDNPAFEASLSQINSLIANMNMSEAAEKVMVREGDKSISFDWTSAIGDKYSMNISSSSPNEFSCTRVEESSPRTGANGATIHNKNVIKETTTLGKSGFITLITNGAMADDYDCKRDEYNNYTWAERKYYTSDGVMLEREYKGFPSQKAMGTVTNQITGAMLVIPSRAFDYAAWGDQYESRFLLVRDKLDTARFYAEDKKKGTEYRSVAPLKQEHGLRDMVLLGGYDPYPQNVNIPPLSQEKIAEMLQEEDDSKVRAGLSKFAIGRDQYSYDSSKDKDFIHKGFSESQGKVR